MSYYKTNLKYAVIIFFLLLTTNQVTNAQKTFTTTGKVVNNEKEGIAEAKVTIRHNNYSLGSVLTNEHGVFYFSFENTLETKPITITIEHPNYRDTKTIPKTLRPGSLGTFTLNKKYDDDAKELTQKISSYKSRLDRESRNVNRLINSNEPCVDNTVDYYSISDSLYLLEDEMVRYYNIIQKKYYDVGEALKQKQKEFHENEEKFESIKDNSNISDTEKENSANKFHKSQKEFDIAKLNNNEYKEIADEYEYHFNGFLSKVNSLKKDVKNYQIRLEQIKIKSPKTHHIPHKKEVN